MVLATGRLGGSPIPEDNVGDSSIRMPGMAQMQVELLRSFNDHFDTVEAQTQAMISAVREMNAITQSAVMFAASSQDRDTARVGQSAVANEFGQAVRLSPTPSSATPEVRETEKFANPDGFTDITETGPLIKPDRANYNSPENYAQGRRMGGSGIRAAIGDRTARAVQNATASGEYFAETDITYNETLGRFFDGSGVEVSDEIGARALFGEEQFFRNSITGEIATEGVAARGMKTAARGAAIRTAVNTFGGGGTLGESVAAGLPKVGRALGVAGLAVGAVTQGQNFIEGQTKRNLPYQQVLGGSNYQGYGERLRGQMFDLNAGFNPLNPADTSAIYGNALDLYAGDRTMRNAYQSEAVRLAGSTGMSAQEVDGVFRAARDNGITALGAIATALEGVSDAAQKAGTNAEEARGRYVAALNSYGALIDGNSASILAQSEADYITNAFGSNASQVQTGRDESRIVDMLASRSGMTGNQYRDFMASDPGGFLSQRGALNVEMAMQLLGAAGRAIVGRFMTENRLQVGDAVSEEQIDQLASLLRQEPTVPDERILAANLARSTNLVVDPDKALFTIIGVIFSGAESRADAFSEAQGALGQGSFDDVGIDVLGDFMMADDTGFFGIDNPFSTSNADRLNTLGSEYDNFARNNNLSDPLIERLMTQAKDDSAFAEKSRFTVQTADGDRVVDIQDLFRNYLDQVSAGTVTLSNEGNRSLSESLGLEGDRDSSVEVTSTSSRDRGEDRSGEATGTITIDMAPELREFFTIRATNGLSIADGAYGGTIVPGSDGRPTG